MSLLAIPNVSEGRDTAFVQGAVLAVSETGARVLDVHTDSVHNRTVLTVQGTERALIPAMDALAQRCKSLDLSRHSGAHPRLGVMDICPIVPFASPMQDAVVCARRIGDVLGATSRLPVFFYGEAAERPQTYSLPALRRLSFAELSHLGSDRGPNEIDPRFGICCVGARKELIAFNVWLVCDEDEARKIASSVRESSGGLEGVRALGLRIDETHSQVSMNLVDPGTTGIDVAFEVVADLARKRHIRVLATELVGLPPARFMPDPKREATRLLMRPGRSLESVLEA
jgi:glutamate formiminotransferase